ncbi:MAG: hypothetical protein H7Y20_06900, partial [Bryobacteraceae bacterium]|nr:hypothetical protein [Bryobacteraceae bacterium]
LATETGETLSALGIPGETRAFRPHVTVARIHDAAVPLALLRQTIASLESVEFGGFTAQSFSLYLSESGPNGSIYTQLAEICLSKTANAAKEADTICNLPTRNPQ